MMKRHTALQDLSRDHHFGLMEARALVRAAEGHPEADAPDAAADRFLAFWDEEVAAHFTEEEHVLLPLYQRHVDLARDDLVQRMLADHAWFRDAVPQLRARHEESEDVTDALKALGDRLREHARFEDRELFVRIEETLSEDELGQVHARSKAFRRQHRGEDAIGPKKSRKG